jgi:hypothetical protein
LARVPLTSLDLIDGGQWGEVPVTDPASVVTATGRVGPSFERVGHNAGM